MATDNGLPPDSDRWSSSFIEDDTSFNNANGLDIASPFVRYTPVPRAKTRLFLSLSLSLVWVCKCIRTGGARVGSDRTRRSEQSSFCMYRVRRTRIHTHTHTHIHTHTRTAGTENMYSKRSRPSRLVVAQTLMTSLSLIRIPIVAAAVSTGTRYTCCSHCVPLPPSPSRRGLALAYVTCREEKAQTHTDGRKNAEDDPIYTGLSILRFHRTAARFFSTIGFGRSKRPMILCDTLHVTRRAD